MATFSEMKTIIKSSYEPLPRDINVLLGQKIDNSKNEFIPEESFCGRYAEVTLYRGELSEESIRSLANCETIINRGQLVDWFVR